MSTSDAIWVTLSVYEENYQPIHVSSACLSLHPDCLHIQVPGTQFAASIFFFDVYRITPDNGQLVLHTCVAMSRREYFLKFQDPTVVPLLYEVLRGRIQQREHPNSYFAEDQSSSFNAVPKETTDVDDRVKQTNGLGSTHVRLHSVPHSANWRGASQQKPAFRESSNSFSDEWTRRAERSPIPSHVAPSARREERKRTSPPYTGPQLLQMAGEVMSPPPPRWLLQRNPMEFEVHDALLHAEPPMEPQPSRQEPHVAPPHAPSSLRTLACLSSEPFVFDTTPPVPPTSQATRLVEYPIKYNPMSDPLPLPPRPERPPPVPPNEEHPVLYDVEPLSPTIAEPTVPSAGPPPPNVQRPKNIPQAPSLGSARFKQPQQSSSDLHRTMSAPVIPRFRPVPNAVSSSPARGGPAEIEPSPSPSRPRDNSELHRAMLSESRSESQPDKRSRPAVPRSRPPAKYSANKDLQRTISATIIPLSRPGPMRSQGSAEPSREGSVEAQKKVQFVE